MVSRLGGWWPPGLILFCWNAAEPTAIAVLAHYYIERQEADVVLEVFESGEESSDALLRRDVSIAEVLTHIYLNRISAIQSIIGMMTAQMKTIISKDRSVIACVRSRHDGKIAVIA